MKDLPSLLMVVFKQHINKLSMEEVDSIDNIIIFIIENIKSKWDKGTSDDIDVSCLSVE